jgi:predicted nuclease of predicted toxin-antitoxin system
VKCAFWPDENIPGDAVADIEAAGHDRVRTVAPGSKDEDILALAVREEIIILTFDKDFGELAWRAGLPASSGIILIRLPMPRAAEAGTILAAHERTDWAGHFTVIEPGRVRMRPLAKQ